MSVALAHPEVPSCAECQKWLFDDKWRHCKRAGEAVPRPEGTPTPCHKCPKGPRPFEKELTQQNELALRHYQECKAVGRFPRDAIVERNAGLIRLAEERHTQANSNALPLLLTMLAARK